MAIYGEAGMIGVVGAMFVYLVVSLSNKSAKQQETLENLIAYSKIFLTDYSHPDKEYSEILQNLFEDYKVLLQKSPWKKCNCQVCKQC